jgi:mRNA interferase RelE/StbE
VATTNRYKVQLHPGVIQQDIPDLPLALRCDLTRYQQVLALGSRKIRRIPGHVLKGELAGYSALEIDWEGVAYRLVYRIYEVPAPRRVVILSFAEHDPAYERAIERKGMERKGS